MSTHLLCREGEDRGAWYVLSASPDAPALCAEAERLCVEDYNRDVAKGERRIPLHETWRRTFFVKTVPDWPEVSDGLDL